MNRAMAPSYWLLLGSSVAVPHTKMLRGSVVSSGRFFPSVCLPAVSPVDASLPASELVSAVEESPPPALEEELPLSPLEHPAKMPTHMDSTRNSAKSFRFIKFTSFGCVYPVIPVFPGNGLLLRKANKHVANHCCKRRGQLFKLSLFLTLGKEHTKRALFVNEFPLILVK